MDSHGKSHQRVDEMPQEQLITKEKTGLPVWLNTSCETKTIQ
jgi:hypothetical protein